GETETATDDGIDEPVIEQVDTVVEEVASVEEPAKEIKVASPVAPVKKAWTCSCGATATGKFCPMCGSPKPAEEAAIVSAEDTVTPSINIEDVAKAVEASAVAVEAAAVEAAVAEDIQPAKIDEDGSFVPAERLTLDELIEEAEKNHESPRLIKDSDTGITLVDYTDII
ncbi:MAG: hypothetical protein KBS83_05720, partial [Lachnospiraceae bacterium]|nr:hypothetical protein [Candidatus Equihabitans merdae]